MDAVKKMRQDVKYIDTTDPKVVKMLHDMLEADTKTDWWHQMPARVKSDVSEAMRQENRMKQ